MSNIVKQIHESDIFGTIVEIGAGNPVSYRLFEVAGASSTVYESLSPYNKQAQIGRFFQDAEFPRSVSMEFVRFITMEIFHDSVFFLSNQNMVFVSSFQLGENICNHGWIAFMYNSTLRFYHLSLPTKDRASLIREIGEIGLQIIWNKNVDNAIPYCDLLIENTSTDCTDMTLQLIKNLTEQSEDGQYLIDDQVLTFHRNGTMCRLETILREGSNYVPPTIPIYKGSFNPPHKAHLAAAKSISNRFHHHVVFMISLDTYGKAKIDPAEIYKRVKLLNRLGYHVIINRSGFYNDAMNLINQRAKNNDRTLVWVAGADTINRLSEMTDPNVDQPVLDALFITIKRPTVEMNKNLVFKKVIVTEEVFETNVSSTQIRAMLADSQGNDEDLQELLSYDPNWLREK